MDFFLDDYGQCIVLIIFGGGIIMCMGGILNHVSTDQPMFPDNSAYDGLMASDEVQAALRSTSY